MLTTSGVPQWKFKYLAARPEPVEGQRLIFSQPLSIAEGLSMTSTPYTDYDTVSTER
jgi:hypothetical protein